jgi:hypothetical protein
MTYIAVDKITEPGLCGARHSDVLQFSLIRASLYHIDENIEEELCIAWAGSRLWMELHREVWQF